MVEEWVVTLGFNKENPRNSLTPLGHQSKVNQPRLDHPRPRGPIGFSWWFHILFNEAKGEKTNVGGVMDFVKKSVLIHRKPQPPTQILANHAPIAMHMGMMLTTTSHFTQDYAMVSHKTPMIVRVKVLGNVRKGKVWQTRGWPPNRRLCFIW